VPSVADRVIAIERKEPRCLLQTYSLPAIFPTTYFCFYFHAFLTEVNNPIRTLSERAQHPNTRCINLFHEIISWTDIHSFHENVFTFKCEAVTTDTVAW